MSLLGNIIGSAVGGSLGGNKGGLMSLLPLLLNSDSPLGGLSGLIGKLQAGGLGDALSSWVGAGDNQEVSADALKSALGDDVMHSIMDKLGMDEGTAANTLKDVLPQLVDKLSPQGELPADDGVHSIDLISLAGKLFK